MYCLLSTTDADDANCAIALYAGERFAHRGDEARPTTLIRGKSSAACALWDASAAPGWRAGLYQSAGELHETMQSTSRQTR